MTDNNDIDKNVESILDDEKIREWFLSRDPNRKKVDPFLDEETAEMYRGKASSLKVADEKPDDKLYGISYSQHERHVKTVARHFAYIGAAIGLSIAIVLALIL